jgi:NADH-ubiquinone oxidoreductase chain 6
MYNLLIINENFLSGYKYEILDIFYIYVIICGILVIIMKNPVISVLFLIGLFSGIAFYLIILGLEFIGLSYLIVYIGAVSILFLFILMLLNVRISEIQSNTSNSIPLIIMVLIIFSHPFLKLLPYYVYVSSNIVTEYNNNFFKSLYVTSNS